MARLNMPVVTITDISIRSMKPVEGRQVIYSDRALRGFGVRVTETGAMSYVLTFGADRRRIKIGDVGIIKLSDARAEAKRILAEQTLGKRTDRTETFDAALARFLENAKKQNRARTAADYHRLLTRHCKSLRGRRMADIEKRDITRIIDRLLDRPSEAYHAIVAIKVFFRWAMRRDIIQQNPCDALPTIKKPLPRSRVLSDDELRRVWHAASEMDGYGTLIQCCIATGLRVGEIRQFRTSWLKGLTLEIPASVAKNNHAHAVPLSDTSLVLLTTLPPGQPATSKNKRKLDSISGVSDFTIHDLRRTFATNMQRLGVRLEVTEKLLNHVSGTQSGITGVYQRHHWLPEMLDAVAKYNEFLIATVATPKKES